MLAFPTIDFFNKSGHEWVTLKIYDRNGTWEAGNSEMGTGIVVPADLNLFFEINQNSNFKNGALLYR